MSDDLPSAWRLQAVLLRSGLTPRTVRTGDLEGLRGVSADVVVFDRGVSGVAAMAVLDRVRPPEGTSAPPALFLVDDAAEAVSLPGETRLVAPVADETLRSAVEELIRLTPRPEPRVVPPLEEVDLADVLAPPPTLTMGRRRRGPLGGAGPLLALFILIGLLAAYGTLVVGRATPSGSATPSGVTPVPSAAAVPSAVPAAAAAPTATTGLALAAPPSAVPRTVLPTSAPAAPTGAPASTLAAASATPAASATRAAQATPPASATAGASALAPIESAPAPATAEVPLPASTGLEGRVTDSATGAAVPGAVVSYRGAAAGETAAGGDGRYRVAPLPAGAYAITASAPGYAASKNQAGVVEGVVTSDNLALQPGGDAPVEPFESVVNRLTGRPTAVYGYRVNPGDTLRDVAERAGTNLAEILAVNRLDDPDHLEPDQVIYLPASTFGQK